MMLETYRGNVYPWQCDILNHMNVQFYMAKFDEGAWQFFAQIGLTNQYFLSQNAGIVAMEQRIQYFKELVAGDQVYIKSELLEIRRKSVRFRHLMYNMATNEVAAEMEVIGVHLNTKTRKSTEFPPEIKAKFQVAFETQKED